MKFRCPVCMFPSMPYPASNYHICPCCSTEFGNDDSDFSHGQLREIWISNGGNWFFGAPPAHWNPWMQLIDAGLGALVPFRDLRTLSIQNDASAEFASVRYFQSEFESVALTA